MPETQDRLEILRIENLVQGFGWTVPRQEITETEIVIELRRPRTSSEVVPEVGPG